MMRQDSDFIHCPVGVGLSGQGQNGRSSSSVTMNAGAACEV